VVKEEEGETKRGGAMISLSEGEDFLGIGIDIVRFPGIG